MEGLPPVRDIRGYYQTRLLRNRFLHRSLISHPLYERDIDCYLVRLPTIVVRYSFRCKSTRFTETKFKIIDILYCVILIIEDLLTKVYFALRLILHLPYGLVIVTEHQCRCKSIVLLRKTTKAQHTDTKQ